MRPTSTSVAALPRPGQGPLVDSGDGEARHGGTGLPLTAPLGPLPARSTVGSVTTVLAAVVLVAADLVPAALLATVAVFAVADVLPEPGPRWSVAVVGALGLAVGLDSTGAAVGAALVLGLGAGLLVLRDTVGPPAAALLVAGSWLGVYLTVPDTEIVLAVAAVLAPVLIAHELAARWGPPTTTFALAGLLVWSATEDARGRDGAAVGALACLALLLVPVIVTRMTTPRPAPWKLAGVVAVLAAAVLVCSRVAGLKEDVAPALVIALPTLAVATALCAALLHRDPGRSPAIAGPD